MLADTSVMSSWRGLAIGPPVEPAICSSRLAIPVAQPTGRRVIGASRSSVVGGIGPGMLVVAETSLVLRETEVCRRSSSVVRTIGVRHGHPAARVDEHVIH